MASTRALLVVFLLLVSACGSGSGGDAGTGAAGGGGGGGGTGSATLGADTLVFVSDHDGNSEVYVADSSGQRNVTNDPGSDRDPAFSPDGTKIVAASPIRDDFSTGGLFVMNANGTGRTNLTNGSGLNSDPYWPGGPGIPFVCPATTAAGALDTGFNQSGMVITRASTDVSPDIPHDAAHALVVQPDGTLVVAGFAFVDGQADFALARYNADGTLDGAFGAGGSVTTSFSTFDDEARALALQADGKLVAAGYSADGAVRDIALARYMP